MNVRVGGFYAPPPGPSCSRWSRSSSAPARRPSRPCGGRRRCRSPSSSSSTSWCRCASTASTRSTAGRVVSTGGLDFDPHEWDDWFVEEHVAHSNALHSRIPRPRRLPRRPARALQPQLRRVVRGCGARRRSRPASGRRAATRSRASSSAASRCFTHATRRCGSSPPTSRRTSRRWKWCRGAAVGFGVSEAPRGLLWHRYEINGDGTILDARIVPPTSQNQLAIEQDLRAFVQQHVRLPDDELRHRCEQAIRNHDPCISCAPPTS